MERQRDVIIRRKSGRERKKEKWKEDKIQKYKERMKERKKEKWKDKKM